LLLVDMHWGINVKKTLLSLSILILSSATLAATATDDALRNLADEYVSDLVNFSPVFATLIGDHSADGKIDQVDAAARTRSRELLVEYITALRALDIDEMTRANQIDAEILMNQLQSDLWSGDELQEWAWNPIYYINISGSAIYGLVARDFAPIETRLRSAIARLNAIPRFLQQSRASLQPDRVPKIHAETAVAQNLGLTSIIDQMLLPKADVLPAGDRARLDAAIETARDALADHQNWLEEELLPAAVWMLIVASPSHRSMTPRER
jgi:uncharacterized protein (DUF885 family)